MNLSETFCIFAVSNDIYKQIVKMRNRIIVENNKVKTVLSEETKRLGYMSIDEAKRLTHEAIINQWKIIQNGGCNNN